MQIANRQTELLYGLIVIVIMVDDNWIGVCGVIIND